LDLLQGNARCAGDKSKIGDWGAAGLRRGTIDVVPVEMSSERFEELVGEALDDVPEELLGLMNNVVILVEDDSPPGERLLGLYEGHALTNRGWDYSGVLPDRITIYRRPILSICDTDDDVVEEVAVTVVHEIAHHFGIDDHRLHELGWG
jgi:predicted Zn-dependent protease with MMP-like domain